MVELITKTPVPGWCKTRLAEDIGEGKTVRLQEALLLDSLNAARHKRLEVRIWFGAKLKADYTPLLPADCDVKFRLQRSLGEMIEESSKAPTSSPFKILIGVDSPHALFQHLPTAVELLKSSPVVLGPTFDGGVYLIGFQTSSIPDFKNIHWGTKTVFEELKKLDCKILPEEFDVDSGKELKALKKILQKNSQWAPNTASLFKTWEQN